MIKQGQFMGNQSLRDVVCLEKRYIYIQGFYNKYACKMHLDAGIVQQMIRINHLLTYLINLISLWQILV